MYSERVHEFVSGGTATSARNTAKNNENTVLCNSTMSNKKANLVLLIDFLLANVRMCMIKIAAAVSWIESQLGKLSVCERLSAMTQGHLNWKVSVLTDRLLAQRELTLMPVDDDD